MPFVYSTLTADQAYSLWNEGGGDLPTAKRICIIKGGTGIANKNIMPPRGVATHVPAAEFEALKQWDAYNRHRARGYIREDDKELDAEKVAADMASHDGSAPLTDNDFEAAGKPAPKTGKNKPKARG
jgi:hypothetical protein